jgi:hypothetical protein
MTADAVERVFAPSPPLDSQPDERTKQEIANTLISSLDTILAFLHFGGR